MRWLAVTLLAGWCSFVGAAPLGTAFTYQGRLTDAGAPATGIYDLRFTLFDAFTSGSAVSAPLTNTATAVTNGLFTTTLDFGAGAFAGEARWLEIAVCTNGGVTFTTLIPRQPLTPAPYALYAAGAATATTAASANSVAAANITGTLASSSLPSTVATNYTVPATNVYWVFGNDTNNLNSSGSGATMFNGNFLWNASSNRYLKGSTGAAVWITNNGGWWIFERAAFSNAFTNLTLTGTYKNNFNTNTPPTVAFGVLTNNATNVSATTVIRNGSQSLVSTTNVAPASDGTVWFATDIRSPGTLFIGANGVWTSVRRTEPGLTTNAIIGGMVGDGVTDNSVALSNLLNGPIRSVHLPAGDYVFSNPISFSASVDFFGDGWGTRLIYTGPSSAFALTTAPNSQLHDFTFDGKQSPVVTTGGAVYLNASNFPSVFNVQFVNWGGTAVFVEGDHDYLNRLNHWMVSDNVFSNYFNGIVGASGNRSEFGIVKNNRGGWTYGTAVLIMSANNVVEGNNIMGYSGSSGIPASCGLKILAPFGRGHTVATGNHFAHHRWPLWIEGEFIFTTINGGLYQGENILLTNVTEVQISHCLLQVQNGTAEASGLTRFTLNNNDMSGTFNGDWKNYQGSLNWLNGAPNTNDQLTLGKLTVTPGSISGSGAGLTGIPFTALTGGVTTNLPVPGLGNVTNTLVISNGVIIRVQ